MYKLHKRKDIDIIGVQIDFGASQKGVAMGPLAIRYAGVREDLRRMGYTVKDKGDIIPPPDGMSLRHMIRFEQVNATNKQLYDSVKESLDRGHFPLVLGGRGLERRQVHAQRQHAWNAVFSDLRMGSGQHGRFRTEAALCADRSLRAGRRARFR